MALLVGFARSVKSTTSLASVQGPAADLGGQRARVSAAAKIDRCEHRADADRARLRSTVTRHADRYPAVLPEQQSAVPDPGINHSGHVWRVTSPISSPNNPYHITSNSWSAGSASRARPREQDPAAPSRSRRNRRVCRTISHGTPVRASHRAATASASPRSALTRPMALTMSTRDSTASSGTLLSRTGYGGVHR